MGKKISIIIPVYNAEKYLAQCIESIIKQTYSNLEIIIINDGSTDRSLEICNFYKENDQRIVVFNQNNSGVSVARNKGLDISNGEFIMFVDADDWLNADFVESLYKVCEEHVLVIGDFNEKYEDDCTNRNYKKHEDEKRKINKQELFDDCLNRKIYTYVIWGKLYKKELIENIRFKTQAYSEDALFIREVFSKCNSAFFLPIKGYNYRIWQGGVTSDLSRVNEKMYGALIMLYYTKKFCCDGNIEIDMQEMDRSVNEAFVAYLKNSIKIKGLIRKNGDYIEKIYSSLSIFLHSNGVCNRFIVFALYQIYKIKVHFL